MGNLCNVLQKLPLALSWQLIQSTLLPFSSEDKVSSRHCDMQRQATCTDVFPTALNLLVSSLLMRPASHVAVVGVLRGLSCIPGSCS